MPVMPQNDAGWRMEPPVSVPVTAGARRAATATALPPEEPSLAVQTAWAVLTLQATGPGDARTQRAIDRGVAYLLDRQGPGGAWPAERASGVFFNTAVLDYLLYRQVFPTWALARYLGRAPGE